MSTGDVECKRGASVTAMVRWIGVLSIRVDFLKTGFRMPTIPQIASNIYATFTASSKAKEQQCQKSF
jgi:hypothetical protein